MKRRIGSLFFAPFYVYYHTYARIRLALFRYTHRHERLARVRYTPTDSYIYIDTHDAGITREILTLAVKEPKNTERMCEVLTTRRPKTILDIGANIGDFVLLEHHAHADGRLVAVEPVSRNVNVLTKNLEAHNILSRTTLVHAALSADDTDVVIHVPPQGNWSSLKKSEYTQDAETETVRGVRFETLFAQHAIDPSSICMRLDIEGYEHDLFCAHAHFLRTLTDTTISIEFHVQIMTPEESCALLSCFEDAGFQIESVTNDAPYWVSFFHKSPLYPLLSWAYRLRIGSDHIERHEGRVAYETLRKRIRDGAYIYAPHITFYKP